MKRNHLRYAIASPPGERPGRRLSTTVCTSVSNDLYAEAIAMVDRYVLTRILQHTRGNQSQAAKMLGITRGSLRNKLRTLHIALGTTVTVDGEANDRVSPHASATP